MTEPLHLPAAIAHVNQALQAVLTIPIFPAPRPSEFAGGKHCVWKVLSSGQRTADALGSMRVYSEVVMLVAVEAEGGSMAVVIDELRSISQILDESSGTNAYGVVFECRREQEIDLSTVDDSGRQIQSHGLTFRILARGAEV